VGDERHVFEQELAPAVEARVRLVGRAQEELDAGVELHAEDAPALARAGLALDGEHAGLERGLRRQPGEPDAHAPAARL
jgi:hypothetical protein